MFIRQPNEKSVESSKLHNQFSLPQGSTGIVFCVGYEKNILAPPVTLNSPVVSVLTEKAFKENVAVEIIEKDLSCDVGKSNKRIQGFSKIKLEKIEQRENDSLGKIIRQNIKVIEKKRTMASKINILGKASLASKEKRITNINDLKKSTLRVKLPNILPPTDHDASPSISEQVKKEISKYCRTCASQKVPLIDVFSEKGIQMKLHPQMEHLKNITKNDQLSTRLCMDCICDLRVSHTFFAQIRKAETKLNAMVGSLNDFFNKSTPKSPAKNTSQDNSSSTSKNNVTINSPNHSFNNILITPKLENTGKEDSIEGDPGDYDYCESNQFPVEDNESIEEFDPDDTLASGTTSTTAQDQSVCRDVSLTTRPELVGENDESKSIKESVNLISATSENENNPNEDAPSKKENDKAVHENLPKDSKEKRLVKTKNLKRTRSESSKNSSDATKVNMGLMDPKIQKLDLENPVNIKTEEDGIMYVTVKGSKPNEMLLIKVKKVDKPSEKKVDKLPSKKKQDTPEKLSIKQDFDYYREKADLNGKGKIIEKQIEQYKKKRDALLGDNSKINEIETDTTLDGNIEEFDPVDNIQDQSPDKNSSTRESAGHEESSISPHYVSRLEKLKQRWQEIKKKHDDINKDLAQDSMGRLKEVLKVDDESIEQFQVYLKQRRIVVSRLKDEDIRSLYETKNNVVLDPPQITAEAFEEFDPFMEKEEFECDFCFQKYPTRNLELEHSKIHDFKITFSCEDCGKRFVTNKARKTHSTDCLKKLTCKYCLLEMESRGKKRQHEQKHCDDIHGQLCDTCGERLKNSSTLDQHIKSKHMDMEKIFTCPKCPKKFAFRTKLSFHLKTVHTTNRPFLCEDCGADFKNPASLRHHRVRKHQSSDNRKECPVCGKQVPVYSLSKHMHTHKAYSIKCPYCDKMFKNSSTLKQHTRIHEDQRQYKCDMCGVGFNRRDGLKLHLKVHSKTDSRGLKECSCQVCGEKFPNHSMLVIHRNRAHKDGRNYTCYICNRSMISPRSLEWHLSHIHNQALQNPDHKEGSSTDSPNKRVSCFHCDKTFKTEMILRTHVKNTHVEKEPVKCLDCELTFTSEVRLRHHMMVEHGRLEGTLKCPHCPKRFVNGLRLKTHMIAHSDERPFTCEICGFTLKTKIQLIKHHQNRHSDERPLQCKYCPWRCKQVSALVCHERTHTNERPYTCSVCKQRFKYLGDKNKHERRHESLGGSGFKRLVTSRNLKPIFKHKEEEVSGSEQEHEEYDIQNQSVEGDIETYEEQQVVKFERDVDIEDEEAAARAEAEAEAEAEAAYEQMYIEEASQNSAVDGTVILGMEEGAIYTEEVTAGSTETEIITSDIMTEQILQPGTVVHLQQEDENGKIQMIPVMLSLPDLSDTNNEVNLATASIMYS